jgi:hypothetical protein
MISRMYGYVRSRQLEGTFEDDASIGTFQITSLRISKGWGNPPEESWPYNGNAKDWPPTEEPPGIDLLAKQNRIGVYQRARSLKECKIVLDKEVLVSTTLSINKEWFNSQDGLIKMPDNSLYPTSIHCISLCGYNDTKEEFKFRNSWGPTWGENGYGYLPYSYFENFYIESWAIADIESSLCLKNENGNSIFNYGVSDLLGGIIHVIEIYDNEKDEFLAWCFGVIRDNHLDIEEFFVRPDYRYKNYGSTLISELIGLGANLNLPLRFWIPESDSERDNLYVVEKIMRRISLKIKPSGVTWAKYVATT